MLFSIFLKKKLTKLPLNQRVVSCTLNKPIDSSTTQVEIKSKHYYAHMEKQQRSTPEITG